MKALACLSGIPVEAEEWIELFATMKRDSFACTKMFVLHSFITSKNVVFGFDIFPASIALT